MNRILEVVLTGNNTGLRGVLAQSAAEVKGFGAATGASNAEVTRSSNVAATALKAAAVAGTILATGLGYAVVKAASFEAAMRNVNSLTGLSEAGLASLSSQVIEMSTRLPQSAQLLAEGLYDISSSGFQGAEGMQVLDAAAQAASAGLTTTAVSAKAITSVLNAYGLTASDASDVSDVLFQTVNLGVLSFDELGSSIGSVVGTAAAAKVEIDEVGAALATMTLSGISGAEAATSLNNLLEGLINPSEDLADTYQRLGYESGEQALATDGLRGVMEKLRETTGGNVTELLALFPSIQAARGALALMGNEGRNYANVSEELTDKQARQGATARVLAEQMKGAGNQFTLLKNEADALAISAGTKVLPLLTSLMGVIAGGLGQIEDLTAAVGRGLSPAFGSLKQVGGDVVSILQAIWEVAGPVVVTLTQIAAGGVIAAFNLLASALAAVSGYLADNVPLASALAAVLAVQLLGGVNALRVAFNANILSPLILGLTGAMTATGGFTAALGAARVAAAGLLTTMAPLLVIGAAIGVTMRLIEVSNAAEDAKADVDALTKSYDNAPDGKKYTELAGALSSVQDAARTAQSNLADLQDDSLWEQFWSWDYAGDVELAQAAVDETSERLAELDEAAARAEGSIDALGRRFGLSRDEVVAFAEANGIDLTGAMEQVQLQFGRLQHLEYGNAPEQTHELIDLMGTLGDESATAEEKVAALKSALDELGGATVSVFEAQSNLAKTVESAMSALSGLDGVVVDANGNVDALASGVVNADGSLSYLTETGRAAGEALADLRDDGNQLITTLAEQGATSDELAAANQGLRDSFIRAAGQMGITGQAAEDLANQYLGIPDQRNTAISASGTNTTIAQIQAVQAQINALTGKTVRINAIVSRSLAPDTNGIASGNGQMGSFRYGGIHHFAEGGYLPSGPLPTVAGIARDGSELVHWAEKGTGGEAFVPLGNRYATKSLELVSWLHGYFFPQRARSFAAGGVNGLGGYTSAVPSGSRDVALPAVYANVDNAVRVFVGSREITDIVDVQVDHKLTSVARNARAAGAR